MKMADAPASVTTNIRGIPVKFPFNPYTVQIDYMDHVIGSLQEVRIVLTLFFRLSPSNTI